MKNSKRFVIAAFAFVIAWLAPSVAKAMPNAGKFEVVHRSVEESAKDPRPYVVVGPKVQVDRIVAAFAVMYRAATGGKELTWEVIQAANPRNTIPVCKIPGDGPMWRGRGDTSVWDNCPEEHRTVALIAGPSGALKIPMAGVETHAQKMARLEQQDACLKDAACMVKTLRALGVEPAPPKRESGTAKTRPETKPAPRASVTKPADPERHVPAAGKPPRFQWGWFWVWTAVFGLFGLVAGGVAGNSRGYKDGRCDGLESGRSQGREDVLDVVRQLARLNITVLSGRIDMDALAVMERRVIEALPISSSAAKGRTEKGHGATGASNKTDVVGIAASLRDRVKALKREKNELKAQIETANHAAHEQAEALRAKLADAKKAQAEAEERAAAAASQLEHATFDNEELERELEKLRSRPSVTIYGYTDASAASEPQHPGIVEDGFDGDTTVVREKDDPGMRKALDEIASLKRDLETKDDAIAGLDGELVRLLEEQNKAREDASANARAYNQAAEELNRVERELEAAKADLDAARKLKTPSMDFDGALRFAARALRRGLADPEPLRLSRVAFSQLVDLLSKRIQPDEDILEQMNTTAASLVTTRDLPLADLLQELSGYGIQPVRETQSFRPSTA